MRPIWIVLTLIGVALLLVSFFILSITLSKPAKMTLTVPDSNEARPVLNAQTTLVVYLGDKQTYLLDRVAPETVNASKALLTMPTDSLSQAIKRIRQQAEQTIGKDSLVLIIKPLPTSSYKNMVNALDIMAALKIKRYALVDELTEGEKALIKEKGM
ncbi:biopolymer transporter ExbD [Fibrella sp. HMF5335]|uniref:Biopolymer transporter ExbD n=1 Tax=Fibrella rubiginis TaxID=2817060 RepID=A0A939GGY3_9BACT|nr:biopolymer transporter ExbD [Fibrella rubiginis]MBO0938146.1 biopolymer transporter ExbD [Fibrella rubiginis]